MDQLSPRGRKDYYRDLATTFARIFADNADRRSRNNVSPLSPGLLTFPLKDYCRLGRQSRPHQVSAGSLYKTGIFAVVAGEFRQLAPQHWRVGSLETKPNARKAGISGPFSRLLGSLAKRGNGWLTSEDSNLYIPI